MTAHILDRHSDEQHGQSLKVGWKARYNPTDVDAEVQCIYRARGRALMENVERVDVAGALSIHQILTEDFRCPPVFAHD
ncbi:MAG: hypothetical protein LAQ69_25935 [Acidobacteriia bacterium]|nr:hypothetical protein [Terriglobia bacterium]